MLVFIEQDDSDPARFLTYLIATLQTIAARIGSRTLGLLQSPQPPRMESILTVLVNEIGTIADEFILVLDDYQVIASRPVDTILDFLIKRMAPQMHLVVITREDPNLPLSRLHARDS